MNRALVDHARLERLADTLMSAVHHGLAAVQRLERVARLHVGVVPLKQRFDVSAVERLDYALERLDVLLRHRLTQYLADATQKSPQADAGEDAMVNRADGGGHLGAPNQSSSWAIRWCWRACHPRLGGSSREGTGDLACQPAHNENPGRRGGGKSKTRRPGPRGNRGNHCPARTLSSQRRWVKAMRPLSRSGSSNHSLNHRRRRPSTRRPW